MQRLLRREGIDLVQPFGLRAELLVRGPASRAGARVISSICSVDPWRRWYHIALDRATANGVAAWISNSEAGKRAAVERERIPERRVFVVPTGVPDRPPPDEAARRDARCRLNLREGEGPVIAVVANLRPAKGYGELIEAVERLRSDWPGLVCLCVGRDDSGGRIPRLIRSRKLGETLRLPGFMSDPSLIYDAADLAVLPSHWEGMPSALIEAMRARLPIVATAVGGVPELIRSEKEGLLIPPGDAAALAEAIHRALHERSASAGWARAARERFEERFSVALMVSRTQEIQEQVVNLKAR
jgi:glycosyltransferase involved in cell wall biosynthesis